MVKNFERFLNESNIMFTEKQQLKAQKLFQEVFDIYLRKVSEKSYPMIYHCTYIKNYESIKNNGLTSERNYFLEYDNNMYIYGFNENDEEEPGIACGVNYKDVIDRLYPDPEWLIDIVKKTGNPESFKRRNLDDKIIYCLWVTDILELDLNSDISINNVSKEKMDYMINNNIFCWLYVKGKVSPELITIEIHPDLHL